MEMKIGWKPLQVHNISAFTITFAIETTIDTKKSTCYWIVDEGSGTTTFF
jgi:hypothetical protein